MALQSRLYIPYCLGGQRLSPQPTRGNVRPLLSNPRSRPSHRSRAHAPATSISPGRSRWSVAENLEHITIVEQNILASLAGTLQNPPAPEKKSAVTDGQLLANFGRVVQPLTAPERLLPTSRWPLVDLLNEFDATASAPSNSPLLRPIPGSCVPISCRIPSSANWIATNGFIG